MIYIFRDSFFLVLKVIVVSGFMTLTCLGVLRANTQLSASDLDGCIEDKVKLVDLSNNTYYKFEDFLNILNQQTGDQASDYLLSLYRVDLQNFLKTQNLSISEYNISVGMDSEIIKNFHYLKHPNPHVLSFKLDSKKNIFESIFVVFKINDARAQVQVYFSGGPGFRSTDYNRLKFSRYVAFMTLSNSFQTGFSFGQCK